MDIEFQGHSFCYHCGFSPCMCPSQQNLFMTQDRNGCYGNAHVWACAHTQTCKCGKAKRELAPPCAVCGQR